ncbi:MAG: LysE family transporter, partial [Pyramidobacter sp.]|nr:LysE family transporter [Pyramidobacter sp.]
MPFSLVPSFVLYCFVSAVTPGPANLCSLAAALKYGRERALIQWRGIFAGFAVVSLFSAAAVWTFGTLLDRGLRVLTWAGAAYILWLAWHILRSDGTDEAQSRSGCSFFTGLFVQLTNPKIIIFSVTALTTYALPYAHSCWDVLKIAAFLPFTGPIANLLWLFAGSALQRFFRDYSKPVNAVMALSLAFCA